MVGDGSYLLMATELVTASRRASRSSRSGAESRIRLHRWAFGIAGFAAVRTAYRHRGDDGRSTATRCRSTWPPMPQPGADVIKVGTAAEFTDAVKVAKAM